MPHGALEKDTDQWSDWLLHIRHADDVNYKHHVLDSVKRIRDQVLDGAKLRPDMTLVDVGAGDGLIGFEAINRVGPGLKVIFTDISEPLLKHVEMLAIERGIRSQCSFFHGSADCLAGIPDASVDSVTTRAVLAYVSDKSAALREFHRILRPGGRLSIGEPVFRDNAYENIELKKYIDAQCLEKVDRLLPLLHRWRATQFPDTVEQMAKNPLTNYSERDMFHNVSSSGFSELRMEFHVEMLPCATNSWDVFLGTSPHPWAPSLAVTLAEQFTSEEREYFVEKLRPIVERNQSTSTERNVYITAIKPRSLQ